MRIRKTKLSIVAVLRERIVRGHLSPGMQLATRTELEQEYGASRHTVQRAVDQLSREGFIDVDGRQATYVSNNPPHLSRYALIFSNGPSNNFSHWSRFYQALSIEATDVFKKGPRKVELCYQVQNHAENELHQELVAAMRAHRYAGLIFGTNPWADLGQSPLVLEPGVPRVAIAGHGGRNIPSVTTDGETLITKAVATFVAQGRKAVAVIANHGQQALLGKLADALTASGITTRETWCQRIHLDDTSCARNWLRLLFEAAPAQRPDGLFITDDNLVPDVLAGLVAAGVRVPEDLTVVAHHNFPWPGSNVVPVVRVGYDARQILLRCVELIDRQRRGEAVPLETHVPAIFEEEISAVGSVEEAELQAVSVLSTQEQQ